MRILFALPLMLLLSCNSQKTTNSKGEQLGADIITENLSEQNSITKLVSLNHQKLDKIKGDFNSFKLYSNNLSESNISSIPFMLDYIKTCIPNDNSSNDSIFFLFNRKYNRIINRLNDSLETKFRFISEPAGEESSAKQIDAFKENLEACGIGIFSTEGMYYADAQSDYFYNNFKDRVSPGLKEYLKIRQDELKQGFAEDAGLQITFDELYQRIKRWEQFRIKYPGTIYKEDAHYFYSMYLETLMTGMDNSRVFDYSNSKLLPDLKQLYEKIISTDSKSETGKIISSYYSMLARHGFKENDSINVFLKNNGLSTMLSVQPSTR